MSTSSNGFKGCLPCPPASLPTALLQQQQRQRERQASLEAEMVSRGIERFEKNIHLAKTSGRETYTAYGSHLMRRAIKPVADGIRQFLAYTENGRRAGPKHTAAIYLSQLDPDISAFLALRICLNMLTAKVTLQATATAIARALESEVRLALFERENIDEYRKASKVVEKFANEHYRRAVYGYIARENDVPVPVWPIRDKTLTGQKLIEIVMETTGYIEIVADRKGTRRKRGGGGGSGKRGSGASYTYHIVGTQKCLEWVESMGEHTALATPEYLPTIIPPRPWTSPYNGGYHTLYKPLNLVKNATPQYLEELAMSANDMPILYEAVNAMQGTGYAINRPVLEVMQQLWDNGGDTAGIPNRDDYALPNCPVCGAPLTPGMTHGLPENVHACFLKQGEEAREAFKDWRKGARYIYKKNASTLSKRLQFARILWLAERFKEEAAIYFPVQLDFRGRCYSVPSFLNPQGSDPAKSLLTFAEGKPLTTPESVRWLTIHGANVWGNDKVSLEERHAWVMENEQHILAIARNPYDVRMWRDADKPWQFLAFCFEWADYAQARDAGKPHVSHLPVAMDGSCNGLQIFSLMLRDPVGGKAVNLLPSERPEDIYQIVADATTEKLREKLITGGPVSRKDTPDDLWFHEADMAERLLRLGLTRASTKRQVMVVPYGGTFRSCQEYTLEHLMERIEEEPGEGEALGDTGINRNNVFAASHFLATLIWSAIDDTVVAARTAMSYMQKLASLAGQEGLPVNWTTPHVGFLVNQAYYDMKDYRVKTRMGPSVVRLVIKEDGEEKRIDKRRQRNGISPNFVHSLDASAMFLSVSLAKQGGATSFRMIHDDYGTHAADAEALAYALRRAFVMLFTEYDVLEHLRDAVTRLLPPHKHKHLPTPPAKGDLDVTQVMQSDFFFA